MNKLFPLFVLILFLSCASCFGKHDELKKWLLPKNHPIFHDLKGLFPVRSMFKNVETLETLGFSSCIQQEIELPKGILVLSHPKICRYLIKKYPNEISHSQQLDNYLARLNGAKIISNYVKSMKFKTIIVPQKWLYRLPKSFYKSKSGKRDYLLIVEKLDICPGGWWGGPNYDKYMNMTRTTMRELCHVLHAIGGCDAWPQNQPFTTTDKIAFIDTEHVGLCPDDFVKITLQYINPKLREEAKKLWYQLDKQSMANNE